MVKELKNPSMKIKIQDDKKDQVSLEHLLKDFSNKEISGDNKIQRAFCYLLKPDTIV